MEVRSDRDRSGLTPSGDRDVEAFCSLKKIRSVMTARKIKKSITIHFFFLYKNLTTFFGTARAAFYGKNIRLKI